jgi:hypothetical protein
MSGVKRPGVKWFETPQASRHHGNRRFPYVDNILTPRQTVTTQTVTSDGVIIPTGDFRDVLVTLVDTDGEPLEGVKWVQSAGLFPTAARAYTEDGETQARMWLLRAAYDSFLVLAESDRPGLDYVWYQLSEDENDTPAIEENQNEATLVFETARVSGLYVGGGADFGGMLG